MDLGTIKRYLTPTVKGIMLALFSMAGPMAVLLDAANRGGLSFEDTMVWMAGSYGVSGLCTIYLARRTKLPVVLAWNIPGAVLIGSVLPHYEFPQMVFGYLATALLVLVSGWLGLGDQLLKVISPAVVMGILSGVLIPFLLRVPQFVLDAPLLCGVPVVAYFAVSTIPALKKTVPPILAAALSGVVLALTAAPTGAELTWMGFNRPHWFLPQPTGAILLDVTLPVFLFIVGVNHVQSISILRQFDYPAPGRMLNQWVGFAGLAAGLMGGSPISLGGTLMSILSPGPGERREDLWFSAMVFGIIFFGIGLFASTVVQLRGFLPADLLATLAGLALFQVVTHTLRAAVGDTSHATAGLAAMIVTLSGIQPLGWGAPLWGLVCGLFVQYLTRPSIKAPVGRTFLKSTAS